MNRTWLKNGATSLAAARASGQDIPAAASWNVGAGRVLALAYAPTPSEAQALAQHIQQAPRDPRFTIQWDAGPKLLVRIDAATDTGEYLNSHDLSLELSSGSTGSRQINIPQVAPGTYELAIDAPSDPAVATIRHESRVLDRTTIAGRYPIEFNAIGNNTRQMQLLAQQTGGSVIPPTQTRPIDFDWPRRPTPLTSVLAIAGALGIALGLLQWHRS